MTITNAYLYDAYRTLFDIARPGRNLACEYGEVATKIGLRVRNFNSHIAGKYP